MSNQKENKDSKEWKAFDNCIAFCLKQFSEDQYNNAFIHLGTFFITQHLARIDPVNFEFTSRQMFADLKQQALELQAEMEQPQCDCE